MGSGVRPPIGTWCRRVLEDIPRAAVRVAAVDYPGGAAVAATAPAEKSFLIPAARPATPDARATRNAGPPHRPLASGRSKATRSTGGSASQAATTRTHTKARK